MDYHSFGAASDAHLLLLRDEVADVGGRRRCQHHEPGTVPHRRRVRAHAGGYTLSGSPGATENVKCSRRHARSSGLGPIEGKDRCLRVPAISMRPFYPPNHGSILSVKCSLLLVYAHPVCKFARLKNQPPEDLTAVDFGFSNTDLRFFPPRLALSSRTGRALDTTRVSAPPGRPRTRSHRQATHRATERKALRTHGRARSFFGPRDISRYNCSSKRR